MRRPITGIFTAVLIAFLCLAVAVPTAVAGKKKHKIKIAQTVYPAPSAHMDTVNRIAKKVTERTDGRIKFKIYGPELADWAEVNEMVMRGDIDMMLSPMSPSYDPRWNANATPYIVTSYKEAGDAFGEGGFMHKMFNTWSHDMNMVWLGTWVQGFTGVSLSKRAATTPEEAKGLKVRVPPIVSLECYWEALGFTPSLIPYSEVPTAIGTGIVDGQAGGGPFQAYSCCRDLNDYFVFYRDLVEVWGYTFNQDKWNELDADDQKIFQEVVSEEVALRIKGAEKEDNEYLQKLRESGLEIVDLADYPEKLAAARDAARKCWVKLNGIVGKVWMDKIRKEVGMPVE